eukprot:TRINITY_DN7790_c0_g1_i2.p1 TRINITY_DN7790_c0_g1~~TRINITY_DN7790_c0_g1_i2.p1  ORF type:complete len:439 (+),score=64.80 TRINITY_DN7790_c0_g1_i2:150-1319(+)
MSPRESWRESWIYWPRYDHDVVSMFRRNVMKLIEEKWGDLVGRFEQSEELISRHYMADTTRILSGTNHIFDVHEDEDTGHLTHTAEFIPRFLTEEQEQELTDAVNHEEIAFGEEVAYQGSEGSLRMGLGDKSSFMGDAFEIRTRSFLWNRLRCEQRSTATTCVILIMLCIFSIFVSIVILTLTIPGSSRSETSRAASVAGIASGTVMIAGSLVGIVGALQAHEVWIRITLASSYWTMAVLTTLLYNEIAYLRENDEECSPAIQDNASTVYGDCGSDRDEIIGILFVVGAAVFTSFLVSFVCNLVLDSINDNTKLADTLLIFRYFNYRAQRLSSRNAKLFGKAKFGEGSQFGTHCNISPAYVCNRRIAPEDTLATEGHAAIADASKIIGL